MAPTVESLQPARAWQQREGLTVASLALIQKSPAAPSWDRIREWAAALPWDRIREWAAALPWGRIRQRVATT
jgi:hypothetical protein